jgi:hypothetical protein
MRAAHYCDDLETLLDLARTRSHEMLRPIEDDRRIVSRAKSTWGNTERGENRFGRTGAWFETDEANAMASDPDAFVLLPARQQRTTAHVCGSQHPRWQVRLVS